jgi:hypothetical protein
VQVQVQVQVVGEYFMISTAVQDLRMPFLQVMNDVLG